MMEKIPYWIVVVDDEALSLTNARSILSAENMKVSCLRSGRDLLKFMEKNTPDLILLDIMMPDMDGFETYDALRQAETESGRPSVPVIFLTGENDRAVEQRGLKLGASDFMHKPIDREILLRRVENTIAKNRTIETLTEEAMVDKLTGFLNKARGTDRISKLCSRKTGAMMLMDLDSFKLVNDLFGHDMGDRVLEAFADIIRRNTRETDTISRIGGDEFLAFYEDLKDESAVASLTLRINSQFMEEAAALMGADHGIPLGVSIGVVMIPENGRDYENLFALADDALYTVKQNGRHGYHLYSRITDTEGAGGAVPEQRLNRILRIVEERNEKAGALVLGSDAFALIYRFVKRFYRRYGGTLTFLMFVLSAEDETDSIRLLEACAAFGGVLEKTLRLSDIIMRDGSNSFCVMLTERSRPEAQGAMNRILHAWEETEYVQNASVAHFFRYLDHLGDEAT